MGRAALGGALLDTADGLRVAYTTALGDGSTAWIVPTCVPLPVTP